jgi:hypothetical protein
MSGKLNLKALGDAILYSSISFAIASVEMSSKFSVNNFATTQPVLDRAADALGDYMKIGTLWAVGTTLVLGCEFGTQGATFSVLFNVIILAWIYFSYVKAFKRAAREHGLEPPRVPILSFGESRQAANSAAQQ